VEDSKELNRNLKTGRLIVTEDVNMMKVCAKMELKNLSRWQKVMRISAILLEEPDLLLKIMTSSSTVHKISKPTVQSSQDQKRCKCQNQRLETYFSAFFI
jgi:hypothetical protein